MQHSAALQCTRFAALLYTVTYSALLWSALLYSTLGGSLAEEVALRHLDDLLALVRDPHLVTTGLGLGLGSGSGWGQGQGHSLLAPGPHRDRPLIGLRGGDLGRREDLLDEARRGVALLVPAVSVTSDKGVVVRARLGQTVFAPNTGHVRQELRLWLDDAG